MKRHVFMLVDAAHFYVSCERIFNAALHLKPTVVLSNNDGCIVALSPEARSLGLRRGQPLFQCQKIIRAHNVAVYSSNYALYENMSRRLVGVLAEFSPRIERYSIDEVWLELTDSGIENLTVFGHEVKEKVHQYTGLPVRVAIASTKELTKIACELLKRDEQYENVLDVTAFSHVQLDQALSQIEVDNMWGIGSKYSQFLHNYGIHSAKDLKDADERWIKRHLTVVGARIQLELKGISCIPLEEKQPKKQEIICAKSFGHVITSRTELLEAVATYTARVCEKLREQDSLAGQITVFVRTNPFATNIPHYANEFTIDLPSPTSYSPDLFKQARACLRAIYRPGHRYDKAGVILSKITPLHLVQPDLFGYVNLERHYQQARFMAVIDAINRIFGHGTLVFAVQGFKDNHNWRMRQERLSPRYTSRWDEILTI